MPRVPDLLRRFRPAGTPGAAGVAGVPLDRVATDAAELAPLFAQLVTAEAECNNIVSQATLDANAALERARVRAREIASGAQQRATSERAAAMARARHVIQEQTDYDLATAQRHADELQARAVDRLTDYAAQVARAITGMTAAGVGDAA
jgi:vacuolar-type H+-ATPase subunit H